MASGYLPFCFRIDIGIFWESRMPSRRWDQPCSYQNQKDLPGCLPDTPWFASGYLPGCGVFDALQKLNFLTIPKWQQRPSKFLSRGFERTSYIYIYMGTGWIRYLSEMNGFACILISVQFDTKCRMLVYKELRFGASSLRGSCNSEPAAQEHAEAGHTMRIC